MFFILPVYKAPLFLIVFCYIELINTLLLKAGITVKVFKMNSERTSCPCWLQNEELDVHLCLLKQLLSAVVGCCFQGQE